MGSRARRDDAVWNGFYAPFMGKGDRMNNQTNNRQVVIERMYLRVLGELAMNRFEWKGLEGTHFDSRYVEMQLYFHALAVFFRDDGEGDYPGTGQFIAMRGMPSGTKNLVDNPTMFTVTGPTFNSRRIRAASPLSAPGLNHRVCVPIWANYFRSPDLDIVQVYASTLAELHRTIEINLKAARRSKVLAFDENQQLTAKNINDQLERGEAVISVNFALATSNMISALDLGVNPDTIEKLSILRARLWNECMGMLGIDNANQDKKERLVASEVDANNDQVNSSRRVNLNARQEAAEHINRVYGLNISVDYYSGGVDASMPEIMLESSNNMESV